jgi:MFS family permease
MVSGLVDATMTPARLGPFLFSAGITRGNALVLLFTSFSAIALITFVNVASPYLFAVLRIPDALQGQLSSALIILQESVQVLLGGLIGALSDRHGRRRMLVIGLLLMAGGFAAYPLAGDAWQLLGLRLFYAFGYAGATTMITTCVAEYIDNRSRGRWIGTLGVCNGLGVVFMATVLSKLPQYLVGHGFDQSAAIRASFWLISAYVLMLAWLARVGLRGGVPGQRPGRQSLWQQLRAGLSAARDNPRIALAFAAAFAARGDLTVLTTFITLWIVRTGVANGMTPSAATARAGMIFGVSQLVGLLWALVVGFLFDRMPRLLAVALAFACCSAGYLLLGMIEDPFSPLMLAAAIAASIGEASAIVASGVLIGQEAPARIRGVVMGTFVVMGSVGQISLMLLGGQAFDRLGGGSPFTMMAAVNLTITLLAVGVLRRPQPVGDAR